ncbi:hypothetical protein B0T11DRAFT_272065 [Plectosphaerella cucumerina]|uniref:Uncharacterized protein n=1 Tax=Plectosphaerella cucumerina TaxID=40658 RepID=A0A8K0X8X7_9PEZI|nr:hypothetical protein B0T11DRAFT_272065 [Plectosphaerella cucumerina]
MKAASRDTHLYGRSISHIAPAKSRSISSSKGTCVRERNLEGIEGQQPASQPTNQPAGYDGHAHPSLILSRASPPRVDGDPISHALKNLAFPPPPARLELGMSPAASRTFCPLQDSAAAAAACPSSGDAFAAGFGGSQSQVALSRRMPPWADVCRAGRARAGGMRVCLVSCVRAGSTMSDVRGNNSLTAESESTSKDSSTYMGPPLDGRPDPTNLGTTVGRRAAEAPAA